VPAYGPPAGMPHAPAPDGSASPPGWGPGAGGQETSSRAVVALVLACASFTAFPVVAAVAALVLARGADAEIAAAGGRLVGQGLTRAARVIAWINLALSALMVVAGAVLVAVVLGRTAG